VEEAVAVVAAAFDAARVSALFYFFMMMSTENKEADMVMCCASCGIAGVDDVKLMDCDDGCDLVKYCSDKCQKNHREQHEEECKKRMTELRDKDLFTMPDNSCYGECPICCLPLPLDLQKSVMMACCSKRICHGCCHANKKREFEAGLENRCVFCREPAPETQEEVIKRSMNRIKKNCPVAMRHMGTKRYYEGDFKIALEYFTKAVELGDIEAHYVLSRMYYNGEGVEKDKDKEIFHLEEAAIGGDPAARFGLGCIEVMNGNFERAAKHFIIAANLGDDKSLELIKDLYAMGHARKEDYADALRAYQAAVDAAKSAEREVAEAYYKIVAASREE